MKLTLFTVPRSFEGEIGVIQKNAVKSWKLLVPEPEILFVSDDPGVAEAAEKYGCRHVPGVRRNEFGTPLVDDVFRKAQAAAGNELVGYINADIVLGQGSMRALERVSAVFYQFLMIGQRTDFHCPVPIDFAQSDWWARFLKRAQKRGSLHGPTAADYHWFVRGMYDRIPPLALGRRSWDNWLVWYALRRGYPVVDATEAAPAIHIGKTTTKPLTPEIRRNRELAGHAGTWGRVNFATWKLLPEHDCPGELFP